MTSTQFKSGLQSELTNEGFANKLTKVGEDNKHHTTLEFETKVSTEMFRWLNIRFMYGVSTTTSDNVLTVNFPIEADER